ncbi:hypothetical protein A7Q09_09390 [Methylacidiphilum sp. Yel]|uniref:hypothetical protein n=1 Tax=Methylacidiphilum sp. Yel TaxID=1847730 RepID=UPI00106B6917|nr:hypothetical protein [Methylacidiphilum sp. Yel]TFE66893.1 hypothetical protein A7Q09_09390 [Methylacidiphilum sp. Yel]
MKGRFFFLFFVLTLTSTFVFSTGCSRQPALSNPSGKYTGCWNEENGTLTCMTLYLSEDGKAKGERRSKTPTNPQERDVWEAEYKVQDEKILIGSNNKIYTILLIHGNELIDPNHKVFGKPIVLKKIQ